MKSDFGLSTNVKCVFFDMDGTLTEIKSPWEKIFSDNDLWDNKASILLEKYLSGEYDYIEFCKRDLSLWNKNGLKLKDIQKSLDTISIRKEGINALKNLSKAGIKCIIISTGFFYTARKIASLAKLDFEEGLNNLSSNVLSVFANDVVELKNKLKLILNVNGDYGHKKGKGSIIKKCLKKLKISSLQSLSIGDSLVSDKEMFEQTVDYVFVREESDIKEIIKKAVL